MERIWQTLRANIPFRRTTFDREGKARVAQMLERNRSSAHGFVVFRLHKRGFPEFVRRYGEDLLSESIPILYRHIKSYDLEYKDSGGQPKPVKFASYIWKRIDGFIIDSLRKEMLRENSHSALHIEF